MMPKLLRMACFCLAVLATSIHRLDADDWVYVDRGDVGMVVSDSEVASRIGRDMLVQGGTAVDAAVATAFALSVSWPEAGNIGGGGFMIVRPADGRDPVCIDYRETAPLAMTANSFTKTDTTCTQKAVGVPGTVRGLAAAHDRFGKLPWKQVVMPAARLAADGVRVDASLANSLNSILDNAEVKKSPKSAELRRVYGRPEDVPWDAGDRMFLPDLARTLTEIAENGPDAFYTGRIAQLIVEEMGRGNGVISLEDLSKYEAKTRPAMRGTYRDYTIIGAPPPSSGGTCVIEALNILENFDLASRDRFDPTNVHLIAEAASRVFADRARHLGDPDFTKPQVHLVSKSYAKTLAESIDLKRASGSGSIAPEIFITDESPETTHFSVVDGDRMAVSNTYTLEASWGSRIVVRGAGFVLNNEMGDFNWFPGETNRQGRIGTPANIVAPGKRMLSSQAPTIVEKDGRVVLVTGSPGGRTIINTVLCVVLGVIDFQMSAVEAVAAARMHHQWFPDRIELEDINDPPHSQIANVLREMGHQVTGRQSQGSAHTIAVNPASGILTGIADYRRGGRAAAMNRGTLAWWDFDDPEGTELSDARRTGKYAWSGDIAGSLTDGRGHFRIRRDSPVQPMQAYLDLTESSLSKLAVEVMIDSAQFAGLMPNEQLRITFAHGTVIPRVTARMIFGRSERNHIILRGEASQGGTPIPPFVVSEKLILSRPIVLRLEVDTAADNYRIGFREVSDVEFTFHGIGRIAADREANFLGLNALNDFASKNEFLEIDRIELQSMNIDD